MYRSKMRERERERERETERRIDQHILTPTSLHFIKTDVFGGLLPLTADAKGVFIRRRGFSTPFQIPPRQYLKTPRESAPVIFFFSSDWLFDLGLKRVRVRVAVARVKG